MQGGNRPPSRRVSLARLPPAAPSFLGCVDLRGGMYQASTIATGFGAHLAQPLLRSKVEGRESTLTEAEARVILEDAMRVLSYRDARALTRIQISTVTAAVRPERPARVSELALTGARARQRRLAAHLQGVTIGAPFEVSTDWGVGSVCRHRVRAGVMTRAGGGGGREAGIERH